MLMPKDTLQLVQDTAVRAAGQPARVFKVPGEPEHVYHLVGADGAITRCEAGLPPLTRCAYDLTAIASVVRLNPAGAEIWYGREAVVGLLGDRNRITLDLEPSPQFAKLKEWDEDGDGGEAGQVEFVLMLRTLFSDSLPDHPTLRKDVSRVDFKKAQQASGEVAQAKVSMSRQMVAEASNADKIPEVLKFRVPVFASPKLPFSTTVKVAFDLDPQSEKFKLIPLAGEIENAHAAGETFIANQLAVLLGADKDAESAVPIFYGEP